MKNFIIILLVFGLTFIETTRAANQLKINKSYIQKIDRAINVYNKNLNSMDKVFKRLSKRDYTYLKRKLKSLDKIKFNKIEKVKIWRIKFFSSVAHNLLTFLIGINDSAFPVDENHIW